MSEISVLGLGLMGAALARALQRAGHPITVWNRTPEKMQPFVAGGAQPAASPASALAASPASIVCVADYAAAREMLASEDGAAALPGRTVIQLGTGTPREARELAARLESGGADYMDGAILGGPSDVDAGTTQILLAGPRTVYEKVERPLACLGGDIRYLGENIAAPAALDLAWLCQRYGVFLGVAHGARLCESEDVGLDLYASMFPEGDRARTTIRVMHDNAYENPTATLSVWAGALMRVRSQARDAGISNEFPEFVAGLFERAIAAGHGEENVAALVKVLHGGDGV